MTCKEMRHVLVTGAGSGIGRAIAQKLSREDMVTVVSRSKENADSVVSEIKQNGGSAAGIHSDLSARDGVRHAVSEASKLNGPIDVLVNNVGIYPSGPFLSITDSDWDLIMNVCLKSCFWCCQEVLPGMIDRKRGWVVNISSVDGKTPGFENSAYSAAKAALISLTRSLAAEMACNGVNVNAVAPGWVATPKILAGERWKDAINNIPLAELAEPENIADAVAFLVSEQARYITGETLNVNGGLLMD